MVRNILVILALAATGLWPPAKCRAEPANSIDGQGGSSLAADAADLALSALECNLLSDAADGRWDQHSLFAAAAIASGVETDDNLNVAIEQYADLVAGMSARLPRSEAAEDTAASVLAFLHKQVFWGGYDLQATELPYVLCTGRYNCVSATVLYNCLSREAGLTVQAIRLPHHTRSGLVDGDRRVGIEATCGDWFKARQRVLPLPSTTASTESIAAPESELPAPEEPISDVALVSMIYYNRAVEALRVHDYHEAVRLNRLALTLDSSNQDARGNLLAAINKRALELTAHRQFAAAITLIDAGLEIAPQHRPLRENREFIERCRHQSAEVITTAAPN